MVKVVQVNNATDANIARSVLLLTTHTKPIFLTLTPNHSTDQRGIGYSQYGTNIGNFITTLLKKILQIVSNIKQPPTSVGKTYEVDEMRILSVKNHPRWLVYALDRETRKVVALKWADVPTVLCLLCFKVFFCPKPK